MASSRKAAEQALLLSQDMVAKSAEQLAKEINQPLISDKVQAQLAAQTAQTNASLAKIQKSFKSSSLL
jgi:hypothetical protein